ncbi:hypothetical protein FHW77_002925 [Agrobacterium sp. RC10-4-1]|uniref:hypothetical protein n=1 Tax=Agrobacterium sp. RC10-4-1 TaxID=2587039 RepID=UPI0015FC3395|nr:hypothetical protein [Agrobacterium sp. RC10-4-1]MBA8799206.1 hypothetical protein [Agrobacterium sp. RC10-4-1]
MQSEAFELIDRFEKAVDANGYRTRDRHTEEEYRAAKAALEAALSAAEPVSSRNDEAGYVEFLNQDVPYVVRDIQGAVAILMGLETRNVIGYRVYDPDSVFAPPAPSVAVKEGQMINNMLLSQVLQNAFFAGRGTSGTVSREDMAAWQDYDPYRLEAFKRIRSAISAQVQDVAGWQPIETAPKDGAILRLLVNPDQEEFTAFDDSLTPFETIGFNNLENTKEDRWEFAGWDWQQDCFITGRGEVIAWSIFDALKPLHDVAGYEASQSAKLWPGQNAGTVIKEMQDIATGEYDGYEDACDPWTADNRADIDRWQSIISDTLPAAPAKQEGGTNE